MESMQRKIKEKNLGNHILLLGEKTNPYPYMAAARAVLLTSSVEGFGLVIAEAVLCGSVPISTDCIGPSDIIGDNQYGLLVPPENPPAFADAMYRVAHDDQLCQQLKLGALEHVWLYDKSRVVKEWQDLILKVAKKNNDQV